MFVLGPEVVTATAAQIPFEHAVNARREPTTRRRVLRDIGAMVRRGRRVHKRVARYEDCSGKTLFAIRRQMLRAAIP
jgi:hypothetical protein